MSPALVACVTDALRDVVAPFDRKRQAVSPALNQMKYRGVVNGAGLPTFRPECRSTPAFRTFPEGGANARS